MAAYPNDQANPAGAIPVYVTGGPAGATSTSLNVSVPTVIKAAPGTILTVMVITPGSAPGTVNDVATNAPTAGNFVGPIPNAVGPVAFNWPCQAGILVVPGTDQVVNVSWQ